MKRKNMLYWSAIIILMIFFLSVFYSTYVTSYDIADHNDFALMILNGEKVGFSHLGYHYLINLIYAFVNIDINLLSCIILSFSMTTFVVWLSLIVFRGSKSVIHILSIIFITFGTAVYNFQIDRIYFGQFANVIYHNPTYLLTRILSLVAIFYFFKEYHKDNLKYQKIFIPSLIMAYATFIKPNFALTFFAALFLLFIYDLIKKKWAKVIAIVLMTIPSLLILFYLFIFTFNGQESGIAFSILGYFRATIGGGRYVILAIICSSLFPLSLYLYCLAKKINITVEFHVAFISMLIGLIQFLFFIESGSRMLHGNFAWSAASGYSLIYFYSAIFYTRNYNQFSKNIRSVFNTFMILHIVSGYYYIYFLLQGGVAWNM